MKTTYEPLTVLAFVAAVTKRVLLGTSVIVAIYRNPVLIAKIAATLDQLSQGRLILGLGAGWSVDEFDAVAQSFDERQEKTDEYLRVLKALFAEEQPSFSGTFYQVPKSIFLPRPVQKPAPAIWIGGNSKRAMRRAAEFGDSWHPTNRIGPAALAEGMHYIRQVASRAGRDPESIKPSLRWNASPYLTEKFPAAQVVERLNEYRELGVEHVCFDLNIPQPSSLSEILTCMERLAESVIPRM
jgi:probable F420-dependent oxidoreductase